MPELHTSKALLDALSAKPTHDLTAAELHRQRVSFILGSVDENSGITRDQVEDVLARQEGTRPAR